MKYQIIIEMKGEPTPATANHIESMLVNPNNHIKVLEVVKLDK